MMSKKFLKIMILSIAISSLENISPVSADGESTEALCTTKWFKGTCKTANCLHLNPKDPKAGLKSGCHSVDFYKNERKNYTIDPSSSGAKAVEDVRLVFQNLQEKNKEVEFACIKMCTENIGRKNCFRKICRITDPRLTKLAECTNSCVLERETSLSRCQSEELGKKLSPQTKDACLNSAKRLAQACLTMCL
jgi:hypothetical protein